MAKTYDSYKDSGIAWIGEIPEGWKTNRLKYLCSIATGNKDTQDSEEDGIYKFYVRSPIFEHSNSWTFEGEGILMAGDGAGAGRVFHHAFGKYAVHQRVYRMADFKSINTNFLYYYLSSLFCRIMDMGSAQSTVPSVRLPMLTNFVVCIPPLSEQHSIASFLDTKCGEIDSLISLQEEMISELQAYKQSVITEAVTKGLDPNAKMNCCASREKNDACISSSETQPAIERKFKDSGVEWIGEIPEGWNLSRAKFLVEITHGTDPRTDGDIPVYGSGAESFKTCGEYKEGDAVLIGRKGTLNIPHYIVGKYWNVDTAFDVKAKNCFSLRYYYYLAFCFDYKKYMSQTTLPGMTQSDYNNMTLPFPPLNIQKSIATYLDSKTSQIDSLISLKQQKIDELKDYKKSIIYEYVTGKKRV
ncbi:MAG: restriction endonuclease subunit S [Prevotella sp.]|nr:restriction endonuclease subunit S [Prevotella sp.]